MNPTDDQNPQGTDMPAQEPQVPAADTNNDPQGAPMPSPKPEGTGEGTTEEPKPEGEGSDMPQGDTNTGNTQGQA